MFSNPQFETMEKTVSDVPIGACDMHMLALPPTKAKEEGVDVPFIGNRDICLLGSLNCEFDVKQASRDIGTC